MIYQTVKVTKQVLILKNETDSFDSGLTAMKSTKI